MEGTSKKIFNAITISGAVIGVIFAIAAHMGTIHPGTDCNPNYSPCIPNVSYDLDCSDIGHRVNVIGSDVYGFDRDGDGVGCEVYASENVLVLMIIYGFAGAFVAGWVGLFVAMGYEKYEEAPKKRNL